MITGARHLHVSAPGNADSDNVVLARRAAPTTTCRPGLQPPCTGPGGTDQRRPWPDAECPAGHGHTSCWTGSGPGAETDPGQGPPFPRLSDPAGIGSVDQPPASVAHCIRVAFCNNTADHCDAGHTAPRLHVPHPCKWPERRPLAQCPLTGRHGRQFGATRCGHHRETTRERVPGGTRGYRPLECMYADSTQHRHLAH